MKYDADIDGRRIAIELEQRNGRVSATIGDRHYDLDFMRPQEGTYLIFVGDHVYEARVWSEASAPLLIELRGHTYTAKILDPRHRRRSIEHRDEGRHYLTAPMPGKVVRVLVSAGDEVKAGQGIVVVEAMKMQNEIKSPKAGRIVEIRSSEGAAVNANQVLAIVE